MDEGQKTRPADSTDDGGTRVKVELSDVMCAGILGGQDFLGDTRAAVCQSQTLHWATGPQGHWTTEN